MSQTWSRNLNARVRREYVHHLRLGGASFRQIADQVQVKAGREGWKLPKGYDERQACQDLKRYLRKRTREQAEEVRIQRELAAGRLGQLLMAVWPKALGGSRHHVAEAARLVGMIADLYGVKELARQELKEGVPKEGEGLSGLGEGKLLRLMDRVFGR